MIPLRHPPGDVNGLTIFYREAGPRDAPTIVLLSHRRSSSGRDTTVAWAATTMDHGNDHGLPRARWRGPESDRDRSDIAGCCVRMESRP
jgi:hypothetical protein